MSTTRTIGSYLQQQTLTLVKGLQVRKFRAHIRAVLFGGHSFAIVAPGYTGPPEVIADATINFGTQRRPLVFPGNDCWVEMDDTGRWHATEYVPTNKCSPTASDVAPNIQLPTYRPPIDTNTYNFGGPNYVDLTFTPPTIPMGQFSTNQMPVVTTSGTYDFGDWIPSVAVGVTASSVGFESNRAFTINRIAAGGIVSDCTLNIYVGTANAAIVVIAQVNGTWTIERHNPSNGALISTFTTGVVTDFVRLFSGASILSVGSAVRVKSTLTAGSLAVTDFYWSCGGVA